MRSRYWTVLLSTAGLAGVFLGGPNGRLTPTARAAEEAPPPAAEPATQEGVEVMTRGPVHEAFAEPVLRDPAPTPVVPKQPPDPVEELPPDQRPEGDECRMDSRLLGLGRR